MSGGTDVDLSGDSLVQIGEETKSRESESAGVFVENVSLFQSIRPVLILLKVVGVSPVTTTPTGGRGLTSVVGNLSTRGEAPLMRSSFVAI